MNYLSRVLKTLKKVTWEKLGKSLKHMVYVMLVIIISSGLYYAFDLLMNMLLKK